MDSPVQARDEAAVYTMGESRQKCVMETENSSICWKCHATVFCDFRGVVPLDSRTRQDHYWIFTTGLNTRSN